MDQEKEQTLADKFYYILKKYALKPDLNDAEKLFMVYVDFYNDKDGLYVTNSWFRKELRWNEQKTSDIIQKLLKKKYIMISRRTKHSPQRWILLYSADVIKRYKDGSLPDRIILDFQE